MSENFSTGFTLNTLVGYARIEQKNLALPSPTFLLYILKKRGPENCRHIASLLSCETGHKNVFGRATKKSTAERNRRQVNKTEY